ncbi:MAG TPA: hypothetical protein VMB78_04585, partial [Dissulfurispiraceae bacterium]|nr:hypothetical protein [Dissulfurispiraceae bacterium]
MGAVLTELFKRYAEGKDFGQEAFMVGGTVRDMILGRPVKDADIAVKGDIFEIGRSFADFSDGSFIVLDKDFGIVRVAKNNEYVDLCKMRGPSIQDDLADRDLTINAMAIPVLKLESLKPEAERESSNKIIIDPFNGLNDLKYGIIRMVSEDNLISDPLRILRVYRFSATLSFQIEVHTSTAVRTHAALIRDAAVERIAEELRHILMVDDSYSAIKQMEKDGLLLHVFPELREFSIEVWNHCRQSYGYVEHILRNLPLYFQDRSKSLWDYFAEEYRQVCIKLSVLFQDAEIA